MLPAPAVGSLLLGKYRLEAVLGEGGMGVVYAARHLQLEERVAVKLVRSEHANTVKLAARLVSEAKATVRLKNDHVVRILDAGTLEDGQPFIVMEYLEGEDLSKWRGRQEQPPLAQTIDYLLQACEAVAEAHSLGIVHRDLKPANLFLQSTATGARIKVLDFGISRILDTTGKMSGATSTHSLVGSPAYASPEQLTTPELVDTRTDIWSLAVVCYELLTGKSPFSAASLALVCTRVLHDTPPRLRVLRRDAPAALERALMLALQKRPQKRPQTIREWAEELAPFGSPAARESLTRIQAIKPVPLAALLTAHRPIDADPSARTLTEWISRIISGHALESGRSARLLLLALALSAMLAVAFGVYWVLRPSAPVEAARAPAQPPAALPALHEPSRGSEPSLVAPGSPAAPVQPTSHGSNPSPLPIAKRQPPRPGAAAGSVRPVASTAAPQPSVDPYLHRK
ncbi:MAG TPA: serine/threonine-protein kinase [Polyangiaceae bacterium]|nr:serine/threonine-protein kinase [Polyangiaceae bacterium]